MAFFRKSPPPRPAMQRRVPRPWDPPETEFPAIAPIDTLPFDRSERTAVAITGIWAYSNGFEIFVTRLIRPDALSLQLSDGRTVSSGGPPGDDEPTEPITRSNDGGTSHCLRMRWWAWPLPPRGPLEFICQHGTGPAPEDLKLDFQRV